MSVILPPNSTGSTVDTKTISSKERQVVALGDPVTGTQLANVGTDGSLQVNKPTQWAVAHTPTTATQATISKAAGGTTVKHVCTSLAFSVAVDGTHAQTLIQVSLRDGATGAGTILWSLSVLLTATDSSKFFGLGGLNIVGTANTAMTLEFSAAGVTGSVQAVSMTGYDLPS